MLGYFYSWKLIDLILSLGEEGCVYSIAAQTQLKYESWIRRDVIVVVFHLLEGGSP